MSVHGSAIVALAPLLILTGCVTLPKFGGGEKAEPRGPMHEEAAKIAENGGLAATGVGSGRSLADATDKAKLRVQEQMARVIESTVALLAKDFSAETGGKADAECDAFFGSVLKYVKGEAIPRMSLSAMEYKTTDGVTTAYALMELSPRLLVSMLEDAQANASVRARFLASRTFRVLEERANKYSEFRRQKARP